MNKATLKVAGTAVLGVALAAAGVGPAAADGLGSSLASMPSGGLPTDNLKTAGLPVNGLVPAPLSGGVRQMTGATQSLVDNTAPIGQQTRESSPGLRDGAPASSSDLPGLSSLPMVNGLSSSSPTGAAGGLTGGLPVHSPLG